MVWAVLGLGIALLIASWAASEIGRSLRGQPRRPIESSNGRAFRVALSTGFIAGGILLIAVIVFLWWAFAQMAPGLQG